MTGLRILASLYWKFNQSDDWTESPVFNLQPTMNPSLNYEETYELALTADILANVLLCVQSQI